jgi:hypothetical protein
LAGTAKKLQNLAKALKIQGFAVEMTLRERIDRTLVTSSYPTPRSLETRTERGFPHSHSDGCPGLQWERDFLRDECEAYRESGILATAGVEILGLGGTKAKAIPRGED